MVDDQQEPNIEDNSGAATGSEETKNQVDTLEAGEGSQEEKKLFDDEQQVKVNEIVGKQVAKRYEEKNASDKKLAEANKRIEELQSQVPETKAPEIPPAPNPDDFFGDLEGLKAEQVKWAKAVNDRAEYDARQTTIESQRADHSQQQQQETIRAHQEVVKSYADTAETFKIAPEQMAKDEGIVVNAGISPDLANHLLKDPQGPLVVNFLAANILELETVRSKTPMDAAIYIATQIKPKLAGAVNSTKTPAPVDLEDGKGAPEKTDPRLNGVTYS